MADKMKAERITDNNDGISLEDALNLEEEGRKKNLADKWPFEGVYETLKSHSYLKNLRPFVDMGFVAKEEYDTLRRKVKDAYKGVSCLHYATMKYKVTASTNKVGVGIGYTGGSLGGPFAGVAIGSALGGPPGAIIGMFAGFLAGGGAGIVSGSAVSHAWNKTIGKATKKKYLENLDENFRTACLLSEGIEAKIRGARTTEDDLAKLSRGKRRKLQKKKETGLQWFGRLRRSYKEYRRLVGDGGDNG